MYAQLVETKLSQNRANAQYFLPELEVNSLFLIFFEKVLQPC
jgi:hypothetical protein